jgi:hypothetical protein
VGEVGSLAEPRLWRYGPQLVVAASIASPTAPARFVLNCILEIIMVLVQVPYQEILIVASGKRGDGVADLMALA